MCGYVPIRTIDSYVRHPATLALAYCGYIVAITLWNVTYPLQIVGVLLSLTVIYLCYGVRSEPGRIRNHVILVGRYSLFAYIAQIALLQLLRRGLSHVELGAAQLALSFGAAVCLTALAVEAVDRARSQTRTVDRVYTAVFS
jgi:prepilin signal peptidase PulO-like enzyme (type II secretory pathway)